jgi:hypothetical protein
MTQQEAIAWARHLWGKNAYAMQRETGLYSVGADLGMHWKNRGESYHSYEFAFDAAGHPPDMNHPVILRAAINELIAKRRELDHEPADQVELF